MESNKYVCMQRHERQTHHWLFLQEGLGQTKYSNGTLYHTQNKGTNKHIGQFKLKSYIIM